MDLETPGSTATPSEVATPSTPPQQVAGAPTPSAPQQPRPSTGPIQLTDSEYNQLLAIKNERDALAAARAAQDAKAEGDRMKLLAEKGQFEEALRLQQERTKVETSKIAAERDQIQQRYLDRERALTVNDATAGAVWTNEFAAKQARQILESKFDVVVDPSTGAAQVVDKITRRPAADVAREWLTSPEASHFLAPKGKGGSPTQPGNTQTDGGSPEVPDDANLTFEQRLMRAWKERETIQANNGWQMGVVNQARARKSAAN